MSIPLDDLNEQQLFDLRDRINEKLCALQYQKINGEIKSQVEKQGYALSFTEFEDAELKSMPLRYYTTWVEDRGYDSRFEGLHQDQDPWVEFFEFKQEPDQDDDGYNVVESIPSEEVIYRNFVKSYVTVYLYTPIKPIAEGAEGEGKEKVIVYENGQLEKQSEDTNYSTVYFTKTVNKKRRRE